MSADAPSFMDQVHDQLWRPVKASDVAYLKARWAYLWLVGPMSQGTERTMGFDEAELDHATSFATERGCMLHYWKETKGLPPALALTLPNLVGDHPLLPVEDPVWASDQEVALEGVLPIGTFRLQVMHAAFDAVMMAVTQGWPAMEVVDGHERMLWAAWMMSEVAGLPLYGFEPTDAHRAQFKRVQKQVEAYHQAIKQQPEHFAQPTLTHGGPDADEDNAEH